MPTPSSTATTVYNATTSPKTATVTRSPGDLVTVTFLAEGGSVTFTPSGGGETFVKQVAQTASSNTGAAEKWTAVCTGSGSLTVSATCGTAERWGFRVNVWPGGSVGAKGSTSITTGSGVPSLSLAGTVAHSVIEYCNVDWNALATTGKTYRTADAGAFTETEAAQVSGIYTYYNGYHADSGAGTGTKVVGMTAPTGQRYASAGLEVVFSGGGTTFTATVSASCASAAVAGRQAQLVRAAAVAASATVVRLSARALSAASAASAVVVRQPARILATSAACSATVASLKARFLELDASAASTATRVAQAQRFVIASSAATGVLARRAQRTLATACASTATTATLKVLLFTVSASAACSATVARVASHVVTLAATAAATAVLARDVRRTILTTVGDSASVVAVGPGGGPAMAPGQRPTLGVG